MHVRIVTFRLAGITAEQYAQHCRDIADRFTGWPGLVAKVWLADAATGTYGGVYLFDSADAADRSRSTELFREMVDSPVFEALTIQEYGTLAAPTAVTAPLVACG